MATDRSATPEIEWIEPSQVSHAGPIEELRFFVDDDHRPSARWEPSARTLAVARWRGKWRVQYKRWHQLTSTVPSPRVDSVVRRVLRCDIDEALALVESQLGNAVALDLDGPLQRDPRLPVRRAPARLWIPWSRPRVPVWLAIEPWWREQAQVSIWLRSTRRWRYPVRYFGAAHRALDQLTDRRGSSVAGKVRHQPAR